MQSPFKVALWSAGREVAAFLPALIGRSTDDTSIHELTRRNNNNINIINYLHTCKHVADMKKPAQGGLGVRSYYLGFPPGQLRKTPSDAFRFAPDT